MLLCEVETTAIRHMGVYTVIQCYPCTVLCYLSRATHMHCVYDRFSVYILY